MSRFAIAAPAIAVALVLTGCSAPAPVPPDASDAEIDAVIARQLDAYWDTLSKPDGLQRPTVSRIEYTTRDTWATTQVSCLRDAGLDAREISGGFAIDGDGHLTRGESVSAQWACLQEYPVDPRVAGYLSDAQALYMYDYFVLRTVPCLELLGLTVTPPPPRAGYPDAVHSGIYWSPYFRDQNIPLTASPSERELIDSRCPPLPANPYAGYGLPSGSSSNPDLGPDTP